MTLNTEWAKSWKENMTKKMKMLIRFFNYQSVESDRLFE